MLSSIECNYFKMSLLKESQHSVLAHKFPLTNVRQNISVPSDEMSYLFMRRGWFRVILR